MTPTDSGAAWRRWAHRCETTLASALQARSGLDPRLDEAMAYACLDGGKRMRPLLVYATGTALGADEHSLDVPAAAVELIHAYSLVHDDLPAMDDDSLRRGKPTVHVAFGEATAILVGDALLTLAFELLAEAPVKPEIALHMIATLARASGMQGMVAGQSIDLAAVGHQRSVEQLRTMHAAKTGALIHAAVGMGALAADADAVTKSRLDDYAAALGLAFQIRDDILDIEGDPDRIGKTAGKDAANAKPTYPSLLGADGSRALLDELVARMLNALESIPADTSELIRLAEFSAQRMH